MRFPSLPVIEHVLGQFASADRKKLQRTCIVGIQHLLESNGTLFEALLRAGVRPDRTYLSGKFYSTHRPTWESLRDLGIQMLPAASELPSWRYTARARVEADCLWAVAGEAIKRERPDKLIVLDDGGFCLKAMPEWVLASVPVVGIEQTMSGLRLSHGSHRAPTIQVATSAAKRYLESPLVAEAVAAKVGYAADAFGVIGVAGAGNIGTAVTARWRGLERQVIVYDRDTTALARLRQQLPDAGIAVTGNIRQLMQQADFVFGCTGGNFLRKSIRCVRGRRGRPLRLASCSSRDIEFLEVIERYYSAHPHTDAELKPVYLRLGDTPVTVDRSGYPVNFDGTAESVPSRAIQLTRGLMLSAVLQALRVDRPARSARLPLSSELQQEVVRFWRRAEPEYEKQYAPEILSRFEHEVWVRQESLLARPAPP